MFPGILYALSPRDRRSTQLDPFFRDAQTSLAAAEVTVEHLVPDGYALLLFSAVSRVQPGAAQTVVQSHIYLQPPGPAGSASRVRLASLDGAPAAATITRDLNWSGWTIVPPDWSVLAYGNYNAGVAANITSLAVTGMLIPIGNISRV